MSAAVASQCMGHQSCVLKTKDLSCHLSRFGDLLNSIKTLNDSMSERIYFDNAATSWPKPDAVYDAIDRFQREMGVGFGRSSGAKPDHIRQLVLKLRQKLKTLVGASNSDEVIFTFNGTDSLNLAIHGYLRPGDHVITTTAEHNSVLRPLRMLEDRNVIEVSRLSCDDKGRVSAAAIQAELRPSTRLVAVIHTSNVTGASNPIGEIGAVVKESNAMFLVDAAQSVGQQKVAFTDWQVDMLAFPGHKSLFGPLGTGCLIVNEDSRKRLRPIRHGGTGASSHSDENQIIYPDAFEVGNHNVPGLVGLDAGVEFVLNAGVDFVAEKKRLLTEKFVSGISKINEIKLVSGSDPDHFESGIVSFLTPVLAPSEFAGILNSAFHVECRAGHHCAALIHPCIGSADGCVRFSFGLFNTETEIALAISAIQSVSSSF